MVGLNFEGRLTVKIWWWRALIVMVKQSVPKSYLTEVTDPLATITQAKILVRLFHILKILVVSAIKFLV